MVTKEKNKGIDQAYIRSVENMYNKADQDIDLMVASSERVGRTQTDIIDRIAFKTGVKKSDAKVFLSALSALATSEVKKNGEFTIPGFGKFVMAERKAHEGRNPATGKPIKIPAKSTIKFRVGKAMKDAVAKK